MYTMIEEMNSGQDAVEATSSDSAPKTSKKKKPKRWKLGGIQKLRGNKGKKSSEDTPVQVVEDVKESEPSTLAEMFQMALKEEAEQPKKQQQDAVLHEAHDEQPKPQSQKDLNESENSPYPVKLDVKQEEPAVQSADANDKKPAEETDEAEISTAKKGNGTGGSMFSTFTSLVGMGSAKVKTPKEEEGEDALETKGEAEEVVESSGALNKIGFPSLFGSGPAGEHSPNSEIQRLTKAAEEDNEPSHKPKSLFSQFISSQHKAKKAPEQTIKNDTLPEEHPKATSLFSQFISTESNTNIAPEESTEEEITRSTSPWEVEKLAKPFNAIGKWGKKMKIKAPFQGARKSVKSSIPTANGLGMDKVVAGHHNKVTVSIVKIFKFVFTVIGIISNLTEPIVSFAKRMGLAEVELMIYGILLMFCGGELRRTITVIEVSLQTGAERVQFNYRILKNQFQKISRAFEEDNKVDLNGDNIPDILQLPVDVVLERKALIFVKVCDPEAVNRLLHSFTFVIAGAIASIQNERLGFIVLGNALADVLLERYASPKATKKHQTSKEKQLDAWKQLTVKCVLRIGCIAAALGLQHSFTKVYFAHKGAVLMSKGLTLLAERNGHYELCDGYADEVFAGCLAVIGLYSQIVSGGDIQLMMHIIFAPLFALEYLVKMIEATPEIISN